jgi:ubiquinone/menaquinone biosynthesis C-methylase UbiE
VTQLTPQYDAFISAAKGDSDLALKVLAALKTRNYRVLCDLDEDSQLGGEGSEHADDWINVDHNLSLSRFMVPILSSKTSESHRVKRWVDTRLVWDETYKLSTIVPVYLDQQAETDWKRSLGRLHNAKTCFDGAIDGVASHIMETIGRPLTKRSDETPTRPKITLKSVLENLAEPQLEPIFDHLRLSLAMDLKRLVAGMENEATCKLSMSVYYDVVIDVLRQVRDRGNVRVTNILWHQEWKDLEFVRDYLDEEARLIRERGLRVERFFIGTPSLFDSPDVRLLIRRNRLAGVIVRCLYVTEDMKLEHAGNIFDWDIGVYESTPRCFVQGHHRTGYLVYGTIGTAGITSQRLHDAFDRYEQMACRSRKRDLIEDRALQLSLIGWRQPYFDDSQPAWQSDPCPMLREKMEFLIKRAIKRRYSAVDRSKRKIVLVDAGCGDGRNLQYLAELCGSLDNRSSFEFELVGVDLCDSAIRQARERLQQMELPEWVSWRVHERNIVDEIPVVSEGVDIFICADTFGQIYSSEVSDALREWRRTLNRSGMLLLNAYTPEDDTQKHCERETRNNNPDSEKDTRYENAWWYKNTYYKYYKKQEILKLMNEANFAVVTLEQQEWLDPPHPGYREEEHLHQNWVVVAERPG